MEDYYRKKEVTKNLEEIVSLKNQLNSELSDEELDKKIADLESQLSILRFMKHTRKLKSINPFEHGQFKGYNIDYEPGCLHTPGINGELKISGISCPCKRCSPYY